MGAPKQKWTSEEEAALKAGILKHGPGKWRTILKDPEFSGVLFLRSNVDLKDKWRNMTVMANGWSSREQTKLAVKKMKQAPKQDGSPMTDTTAAESDEEAAEARPATTSSGSPQIHGSKKSMIRLDNLIMEAISSLKEPGGSNKTTIAEYIEAQYWAPPNFKRLLSGKLKYLTATGKLIKIDLELAKMKHMKPQEAAAAAAQAVAEAEAAIVEAEEADREADAAEADAEAAQAFSVAANKTLHGRSAPRMMIHA
ncbi:telomere repeat-binding factor 1 isoform X4 [Capsicum annuum]|uniref:telomere repeat-binding factor 1 isoform X4 n=1 Tax=Capsicum annuum TaxID=4072 RepID=UPI0007BEADE4|nr:telomere repeat-binding factor 1 isoform X4 [Capsicum annuum]